MKKVIVLPINKWMGVSVDTYAHTYIGPIMNSDVISVQLPGSPLPVNVIEWNRGIQVGMSWAYG